MSKLASEQVQSPSESLALKEKLEEMIPKYNNINTINAQKRSVVYSLFSQHDNVSPGQNTLS